MVYFCHKFNRTNPPRSSSYKDRYMKNSYPLTYFIKRLKKLDKRMDLLPEEDLLEIINDGFAEVSTIGMFFSDEEVISMVPYYEAGEKQITLDIQEDVTQIYDYYLTQENQSFTLDYHGINKLQDSRFRRIDNSDINSMWLDSRYDGRVHIDLNRVGNNVTVDNAVVKYFYVPTSDSDVFYMDNQTRLATESAIASAGYDYIHDVERASQKRAAMKRQAMAIIPTMPEDLEKPYRAMFPGGGV